MYKTLVNYQEPVATGLHTETQVGRNRHKTLISKSTLECLKNSKSGFEEMFREVHASRTKDALDIQDKNKSLTLL